MPEIKKCPFCGVTCDGFNFHKPDVGIENEMRVSHPIGECILSDAVFRLDDWNRRSSISLETAQLLADKLQAANGWIRRIEERADELPKLFLDNIDVKPLRKSSEEALSRFNAEKGGQG